MGGGCAALTHVNPPRPGLVQAVRVIDPISAFAGLCAHGGGLRAVTGLAGMVALGLAGSAAHCAPMCGPLVLGQGLRRLSCLSCARMGEADRLRAALLGRYHAGRIVTYALLGALAGAAGFGLEQLLAPLRAGLLLAAALAMAVAAWRAWDAGRAGRATGSGRAGAAGAGQPAWMGWTQPAGLRPGSFSFGMAMGLLPCGLIYTALLAACASGSPGLGAAAMASFGLATVPALALVGLAGQAAPVQRGVRRVAPLLLAVNAGVLVTAALARIFV